MMVAAYQSSKAEPWAHRSNPLLCDAGEYSERQFTVPLAALAKVADAQKEPQGCRLSSTGVRGRIRLELLPANRLLRQSKQAC
jgi:hypothetical protein